MAGETWSDGEYTNILNASSRFFIRRLPSGRVLLIHNEAHDFRRNLVAKLSEDDGVTWPKPLLLDDAENPERSISYPDAAVNS